MIRSALRAAPVCIAYFAIVFVSVLFASLAHSQPPLTITSSGYYLTEVDSNGVPSLVQITTVIDMTGGDSPTPPDEGEVDAAIVKQVRKWADAVDDPQSAQAIAAVYSHVRGAVDEAILDSTTVWPALKDSTDSAIELVEGVKSWKPFRDELSAVVTEGRQRGTLQSPSAISRMARSVQHGLELSADGSDALPLDVLTKVAAKTNEAIDEHK